MTNSLFEKYVLCDEGFRNVYDPAQPDGPAIGFQLKLRAPYYRGPRLSLIDRITVRVDGREFDPAKFRFTTHNGTFTMDEMRTMPDLYWNFGEKATLTVMEPSGIGYYMNSGYCTVEVGIYLRISYQPVGFSAVVSKPLRIEA